MNQSLFISLFVSLVSAAPLTEKDSILAPFFENNDAVPGQYIIIFKDGHQMSAHESFLGRSLSGLVRTLWDEESFWPPYVYSANLDDLTLALIRADPMVDFVEQDFFMKIIDNEPTANETIPSAGDDSIALSSAISLLPKWCELQLGNFDYDTNSQGQGVDIYIVDSSGINIDHVDFGGRATNFFDATEITFYDDSSIGGVRGHGTEGPDGVRAVKRITSNHNSLSGQSGFRGSVVNYSVDIPVPTNNKASLGQAISAADAQNIIQVAAAGSSNDQAINHLPAAYNEVITVASMTDGYALSGSTSYGKAVDIIAPGTGITAAAADSNDGYYTISGTSFASPLVAGVCAQFMFYVNGPRTKADLYNMLIDFSIKDQVDVSKSDGNTPNRVVNNGANTRSWPGRDEVK